MSRSSRLVPVSKHRHTGDKFFPQGFVSGFLIFVLALAAASLRADTNENAAVFIGDLRRLVEEQNQKINELNARLHELEEKETRRETNAPAPRLPAIVIDTNGAPLGTLAISEGTGAPTNTAATNRPQPQLSAGANGFAFRSADSNFTLAFHGLVQADSRSFFDDNPYSTGNDGFLLRRARPILEGTLFHDYGFLVVPDFGGSKVQLFDACINARFLPELQLKAGKFKGPVSLENLQTDAAAPFNERSLASDLAPMRNVGVQLGGDLDGGTVSWAGGVYNATGDGRLPDNSAFSDDLEFAGRLFFRPFKETELPYLRGFGFGLGGSYSEVASNSAALPATTGGSYAGFWTAGQQQFFAYNPALGPVVADGAHWRLAPQGCYYVGPFGVQGEYIVSHQDVLNCDTGYRAGLENTGWQVSLQWVLTGEDASFDAITPAHPFNPRGGGWGAWQLVARYSELDVDPNAFNGFADPDTSAQSAGAWTVGLNWWLNANVRVLTSFSHTTFHGGGDVNDLVPSTTVPPATVSHQSENVLFTRIQIAF